MSEDILVNITPQETRVAIVQQAAVQELHIERTLTRGLVGNICLLYTSDAADEFRTV